MYEYEPPGGDDSSIATGLPDACLVSDPSTVLGKADPDNPDSNPVWSADQNSCQATFATVDGARATNPEHRLVRFAPQSRIPATWCCACLSYPAWRVRVNGQLVTDLPRRDDGLMAVPVPQGPVDLTVDWVNHSRRGGGALAERRERARARSVRFTSAKAQGASFNMKAMAPDVKSLIQEGAELTDRALEALIPGVETVPASIHGAMRHSVFAGGKRLRPVLAMQAGVTIAGTLPKGIERLGAALEMLHTYSLIHDDLPALDNDDLRRGKPTCHVAFGEAIAILAGDALQTRAFEVLAGLECPPAAAVQIIGLIANAVGTVEGMIGGQVLDLESEHLKPTPELVQAIHRAKTGALIRVSVVSGGVYAGAKLEDVARLTLFGCKAGLAFQIADDVLDMTADSATLGKTAGKDQATEKATWPAVYGIEQSRRDAARLIEEAFAALDLTAAAPMG